MVISPKCCFKLSVLRVNLCTVGNFPRVHKNFLCMHPWFSRKHPEVRRTTVWPGAYIYRIAGNFRMVQIFAYFA